MPRASKPAHRRYLMRVAIAMAAYIVTLTLALRFVRTGEVAGIAAYALGILPGLSVAAVFWAVGRLIVEETDEYLRMLIVRQVLIATGFTLSLVTIWGFLETLGLVAHVDAYYVAILWFAGLGVGGCWNRVRP
jgi:hypothetical protein